MDATPIYDGNVIIIGAGAAGLYAAQLLQEQRISVSILEATDRFGGRIRVKKEFFDFPLEEGADWIIGDNNPWFERVNSSGIETVDFPDNPLYEIDGIAKVADMLSGDNDFQQAMQFIDDIAQYNGPDLTVKNAVVSANIPSRVQYIVNAIVANRRGASFDAISIKGISDGLNLVDDGIGKKFAVNQSLVNILSGVFSDVLPLISFSTPVTQIDYSDLNTIKLTDANGDTHEATRVIITCPLAVLKSGDIVFNPPLPVSTTSAMNRIGMAQGYKVALNFFVNFWGQEVSSIFTAGTAPEYYAAGIGRNKQNSLLTALIMGENATSLDGLTDEEITLKLLGELDAIYSGEASQQFSESYVTNWGSMPYIQGVTSYPVVSGTGAAKQLSQSVNDQLFFAGEATALKGNYGTIQGALESAERVVEQVLESIQ